MEGSAVFLFLFFYFSVTSEHCLSAVSVKMWLPCILLLPLLSVVSGGEDSKAVTTTLTTKWMNTPLLLEAR